MKSIYKQMNNIDDNESFNEKYVDNDDSTMADYGFEAGENDMNDLYFYKEDSDGIVVTVHGNDAVEGVKCPDAGRVIKRPTKVTLTDGDEETVLGAINAEYEVSSFADHYVLNDSKIEDKVWNVLNKYLKSQREAQNKGCKVKESIDDYPLTVNLPEEVREIVYDACKDAYENGKLDEDLLRYIYEDLEGLEYDKKEVEKYFYELLNDRLFTEDYDMANPKVEEAFSYEDDEFFTREEVDDFAEKVCDHVNETFGEKFEVQASYITNNEIEVIVYNYDLGEFTGKKKVDMRRIRKPSDLDKYVLDVAADIIDEIKEVLIDSDYRDADEGELKRMGVYEDLDSSNKMFITVRSGVNSDGFIVTITDKDGKEIFKQRYDYGYNASYKRSFADDKAPFVADIISELCAKYNISKNDINYKSGENVFKGSTISDKYITNFKAMLNESLTEDSDGDLFGVFSIGGSIGSNDNDNLRAWNGNKSGQLVKVFHSSAEAQDYAKSARGRLSKGERSYYGMNYFIKKLSKKDKEHPQVIKLINESVIKESPEDDGPYSYKELESELAALTNNWTIEKGVLKCGYDEEKDMSLEILSNHDYECDANKDNGWWKIHIRKSNSSNYKIKESNSYGSRYTDYNKENGWTDEDIETHKNTDWAARNYMDLPIPKDSFTGIATAYTDTGVQRVKCKFIKFIRANSIYPPYYAPENEPFKNVVGPMYDGNKYKTYDIHDRYESQDIYDSLSR